MDSPFPKRTRLPLPDRIARRVAVTCDRLRGLDFSTVIGSAALGFDENLVHRSSPSGDRYLTRLLSGMAITPRDRILDIGCGKGSAIRRMVAFPFAAADGIEISSQVAAIASANFRKLGRRNVHIFNADATSFADYGGYNFLYLYNPFPAVVMEAVLAAVRRQAPDGRETIIIYNNPLCHDAVVAAGFAKLAEHPDMWGNGIAVYSSTPHSSRLR
jgi:SAM-dependent methyltransferase